MGHLEGQLGHTGRSHGVSLRAARAWLDIRSSFLTTLGRCLVRVSPWPPSAWSSHRLPLRSGKDRLCVPLPRIQSCAIRVPPYGLVTLVSSLKSPSLNRGFSTGVWGDIVQSLTAWSPNPSERLPYQPGPHSQTLAWPSHIPMGGAWALSPLTRPAQLLGPEFPSPLDAMSCSDRNLSPATPSSARSPFISANN